jgi:histidinol-phosphate/aromatic aminotransferase/cobyric acid decarboxylase-like protein
MIRGHGGDIYSLARELGRSPGSILDFSSNVSPLPLPEGLKELLISHLDEICCLPEVDSLGLREALASFRTNGQCRNTRVALTGCQRPISGIYLQSEQSYRTLYLYEGITAGHIPSQGSYMGGR